MDVKNYNFILDENGIQKYIKKDDSEILNEYKTEIKKFKNKACKHINYLKLLMFITIIFLSDIKFFDTKQAFCTGFLILFNIAFSQNIINNFPKIIN
jgi:hypothetical protein